MASRYSPQQIGMVLVGLSLALVLAGCQKKVATFDPVNVQEVATLRGHYGVVTDVAFSPDSKTLASGSWDDTIKLWDVETRAEIATLDGHSSVVNSVAFSPDGKTLASGNVDLESEVGFIKLWDVETREEIATLEGQSKWINSVAFSPDGKILASGSGDNTIKLWDVATRKEMVTLRGHSENVISVAFSPDGKTLASGSSENAGKVGIIKLWEVATAKEITTLRVQPYSVLSLAFSPDGKTLASGGGNKTIKLWQPASVRNSSGTTSTPQQQVSQYVTSLPDDSQNVCEYATSIIDLSQEGLGSAKVTLIKAGALGEKSSLEVAAKITAIMSEAGYEAATNLNPTVGMGVSYQKDNTYYQLGILDSGFFADAKVVCWFQVK